MCLYLKLWKYILLGSFHIHLFFWFILKLLRACGFIELPEFWNMKEETFIVSFP